MHDLFLSLGLSLLIGIIFIPPLLYPISLFIALILHLIGDDEWSDKIMEHRGTASKLKEFYFEYYLFMFFIIALVSLPVFGALELYMLVHPLFGAIVLLLLIAVYIKMIPKIFRKKHFDKSVVKLGVKWTMWILLVWELTIVLILMC